MNFDWKKIPRPRSVAAFLILAAAILFFFLPILSTYFLADDYNYVGYLLTHARAYVQGSDLGDWFIAFSAQGLQNPDLSVFFRPVVQWLWLSDFIACGTSAFGYHLTNLLLHTLNSFLVYLVVFLLLRQRWGALAAGLLFALHPIHADSVSWIADRTDVLSAFFYFLSATYFMLYRLCARRLFFSVSIIAFALAIGTKENTVALALVLIAYDLLFVFRGWNRRIVLAQIPYAFILILYVTARFIFLGQFGRNTGGGFLSFGAELFAQFYVQSLAQPFITDIDRAQLLLALAIAAIILVLYRDRRAVWFGLAWIIFSLLPSSAAAYVAPRLAYAPSAGLAIALAAVCLAPVPTRIRVAPERRAQLNRYVGIALALFLLTRYGVGMSARVDDWYAAGTVARIIPEETKKIYPSFPRGARLQFVGAPEILRGIYIYNDNFATAFQIAYQDTWLRASNADKFPVYNEPENAYFFDYRRRVITERADIARILAERKKCLGNQNPAVRWDFSSDAQGWQAWNDLAPFEFRDGALFTRATGNDPYLASPPLDIPALAVGDVEIEMLLRAAAPSTQGAIFWSNNGEDFSPVRRQNFSIQADGAMHTYRVDLARDEKLFIGDHIAQLRLDPGDMPGDLAIKSIQVNVHCRSDSASVCVCP